MPPQRALPISAISVLTLQLLLMTPLLLLLLQLDTVTSELTIDSDRVVRKEVGGEASFQCSDPSGEIKARDIRWNYTVPRDGDANFTARVTNANGTLTISSLVESDSGDYLCVAANSSQSLRAILKVFQMPDYVQYGVIMTSVAGALLLILTVGQTMKVMREKAKRKSLQQKK